MRPMVFLACLGTKRRLGAYLDGALAPKHARAVGRHLQACAACQADVSRLERLRTLLSSTMGAAHDPDWTGFWEGVRRGIHQGEAPAVGPGQQAWRRGWYPRLALGGALVGLVVLAALFWPASQPQAPSPPAGVVVRSVGTADPKGNLMLFSSPEDDMTVIWVFGLDQPGGGEEPGIVPASLSGQEG